MSTFGRTFAIEKITGRVLEENPWFKDMLLDWRPAGDALHRDMTEAHKHVSSGQMLEEDPERLRLAIRKGYINLYRGGQSIAEIHCNSSGALRALIHNKFVYGDKGSGQAYVTLTSAGLPDQATGQPREYGGRVELRRWVHKANEYVKKHREKQFVDLVVARNPNVIDLEMGLPAYSTPPTAPRMDQVVLERADAGWCIAFWEAKLSGNPGARCSGPVIQKCKPEVLKQLGKYTDWLHYGDHCREVTRAYQIASRLLVDFHAMVKRFNANIEELGEGIQAVARGARLSIDDQPRLLIDDRKRNVSFIENGHLKKLRKTGLHVQMVHSLNQMTLDVRP